MTMYLTVGDSIFSFIFGVYVGWILNNYLLLPISTPKESPHLVTLKKALLSYAMREVYRDQISICFGYNSDHYDGSMLPPFSGYDITNACFTYMSDLLPSKVKVIDMFIKKNLSTRNQVIDFFESFIKATAIDDDSSVDSGEEENKD
jgi:hypothetical protein